jgi:broad specificity phosphatase PhoE
VGHADLPLSAAGARDLAALAPGFPAVPDRVFASDLARARRSAEVLAEGWGSAVETDARLREMDFGEWDGRTWAELEAADGARLTGWMGDWVNERAPGGESFTDVAARAAAWAAEMPGEGTAVAVAHAGSIRALLCHLLGLPLEAAFRVRVDHARVSAVRLGSMGAELLFANASRVPPP